MLILCFSSCDPSKLYLKEYPYEFLIMAKTGSRLDINLGASQKIKSIMLRSIFEVTKNWKKRSGRGAECGQILQNHNRRGKRLLVLRKEPLSLHPGWLSIDLALFISGSGSVQGIIPLMQMQNISGIAL